MWKTCLPWRNLLTTSLTTVKHVAKVPNQCPLQYQVSNLILTNSPGLRRYFALICIQLIILVLTEGIQMHIMVICTVEHSILYICSLHNIITYIYSTKSGLRRVRNCCMLVLRLCFVMVASQHVVDTRQMLYKYMILWKLCGHKPMNNTVGYSLGGVALTRHSAAHLQP